MNNTVADNNIETTRRVSLKAVQSKEILEQLEGLKTLVMGTVICEDTEPLVQAFLAAIRRLRDKTKHLEQVVMYSTCAHPLLFCDEGKFKLRKGQWNGNGACTCKKCGQCIRVADVPRCAEVCKSHSATRPERNEVRSSKRIKGGEKIVRN